MNGDNVTWLAAMLESHANAGVDLRKPENIRLCAAALRFALADSNLLGWPFDEKGPAPRELVKARDDVRMEFSRLLVRGAAFESGDRK